MDYRDHQNDDYEILAEAEDDESLGEDSPTVEEQELSTQEEEEEEEETEWSELAQFVVVYEYKLEEGRKNRRTVVRHKTAVHHVEGARGGGEDQVWDDLEFDGLGPWIRDRVCGVNTQDIESDPERDEADVPSAPLAKGLEASVEITHIRLRQLPDVSDWMDCLTKGEGLVEVLRSREAIEFELSVQIDASDDAAERLGTVQFGTCLYAEKLDTLERVPLVQDPPYRSLNASSEFKFYPAPVRLEPGTYRLDFVTAMSPTLMRQAHVRIPFLQVA